VHESSSVLAHVWAIGRHISPARVLNVTEICRGMTELPVTNCRNAQRSSWSSRETNCCKKCNVFSWSWRRCSSSGTMTARTYCAVGCCCWKRWSIAGTVNNDQNASLWTSGMPNFMSSTHGIGLSKSCCCLAMLCANWQMLCAVGKVYMPYSPRMVSRLSYSWMVKLPVICQVPCSPCRPGTTYIIYAARFMHHTNA